MVAVLGSRMYNGAAKWLDMVVEEVSEDFILFL